MNQSAFNDLIRVGINFGFVVFFFGILFGMVTCIIKCYNNDDDENHDHHNINDHVIITIIESAGIKPSILRSIPIVDFNSQDFEDGVECVVCLSELVDGDKVRGLPSCNHWFHADCINSWFRSHSTCPICRKRVGLVQRGARPELGGDESHGPRSENPGFLIVPSPSTETAVAEDVDQSEANNRRPDLTAVMIDVPAKGVEGL